MPGGGLTAIGLAGLVTSYSGIAHTFIDGMHALTGLLFMFGLIIMTAGLLEGGISTSNRTKAIPEYDVISPTRPIAVNPPPGIIRSQLLNSALMLSEYYFILM